MAGGAVPDPREPVAVEGDPDEVVPTLVAEEVGEPDPDAIEPVLDE
ncbi:MAG TPA: hypothetical protein VGG43_07000 [Acidimicrobiales bacterium]|jgi:hypothetical protein